MRRINLFIALFFVLALTAAVYWPSLFNGFVNWDDPAHLIDNRLIRGLDWPHVRLMFDALVNGVYLPLTLISFAVEYHFFGLDPFVFHLDNLILHLGVVGLVFGLAFRLGLAPLAATVAALLFGVHPMHVESVAWVTERKDVLYAFFYLLSLHAYLYYMRSLARPGRSSWSWLAVASLCGILSLLSKPMAISLPIIWLVLDVWERRRLSRQVILEKIPILLGSILIGWMTYSVYARVPESDWAARGLIWVWTAVFYIKQFVFPIYSVPIFRLPEPAAVDQPEYLLSLVVFGLMLVAVYIFRRQKWFVLAVSFYFLSIFFLWRFDRYDINVVADRFMYLPSVGFCLWAGWLAQRVWESLTDQRWRRVFMTEGLILLAVLSLQTFGQNRIWRNSISLWSYQLGIAPSEKIALNNLGNALRQEDGFKQELDSFRQRLVAGQDAEVKYFPAARYVVDLYEQAIQRDAQYLEPYYNLASLCLDLGNPDQAVVLLRRMLAMDPFDAEARIYLGEGYQDLGLAELAVAEYWRSIRISPDEAMVYAQVMLNLTRDIEGGKNENFYRAARSEIFKLYKVSWRQPLTARELSLRNMHRARGNGERAGMRYHQAGEKNRLSGRQ